MTFDPRVLLLVAISGYRYVVFLRIILSWFPFTPPDAIRPAFNFLYDLTEPFLRLFRRVLPPVTLGGMGLDLSPLVGFFVLYIVEAAATRAMFG